MVKSKFEDLLYSYRSTNSSSGITASSKASNKCAWVSLSGILGSQINLCEFVLTSYKCEQVDARRREISPKSAQQFVTYGRHNLPFTLRGRVRLPKPTSREKNFCRFKLVLICHHCYSCCMTKSRLLLRFRPLPTRKWFEPRKSSRTAFFSAIVYDLRSLHVRSQPKNG